MKAIGQITITAVYDGTDIQLEYSLSNSPTIPPDGSITGKLAKPSIYLYNSDNKLDKPVIYLSESSSTKLATPTIYLSDGDTSTNSVLGYAILGLAVLGTPLEETSEATATSEVSLLSVASDEVEAYSEEVVWSTTVPTRAEGQYIWQRVKYIHADGSITYGDPVCITGDKGDLGKGISLVVNYYLITDASSGITLNSSGWSEEAKSVSADYKYLWNYERVVYNDGSYTDTSPCIIGAYGNDGEAGVGIESVAEYYAVSRDIVDVPTDWVSSEDGIPTMTSTLKYLWNYEVITYTDGNTKQTNPCVIGVYGDKGDTGASGKDAVLYRIESSLGFSFLNTQEETTTLKAIIYKGMGELDSAGAYGYTWYLVEKDGTETVIGTGKTLSLSTMTLAGKGIYFIADDSGVEEELIQLDTPEIVLVDVNDQLDTPEIVLVDVNDQLDKPTIELIEQLERPTIELVEE